MLQKIVAERLIGGLVTIVVESPAEFFDPPNSDPGFEGSFFSFFNFL